MYSERLRTLSRAYAAAERNNKLYNDAKLNQSLKLGQVVPNNDITPIIAENDTIC